MRDGVQIIGCVITADAIQTKPLTYAIREPIDSNFDDCQPGLVNSGKECYSHCLKSGTCSWCGTGKCCRVDHTPTNDCEL